MTIKTKTVDASPFVSTRAGATRRRARRTGASASSKFPINGRVWYPDGDGPFPLVLIVHGNHDPLDYSDPGYGYLGELLASRGFILVSVDENFINGNLRGESDGRAWLLLKHLEDWKQWNDSSAGPFYAQGRHEQHRASWATRAAARRSASPRRSIGSATTPTTPTSSSISTSTSSRCSRSRRSTGSTSRPACSTPIENVNYMVIHGSHDGDVSSFNGLRAFQRIKFTDGKPWFKAAWYVYRANHGQWNTVWGNKDNGPRSGRYLDLRGLISPEEQRQFSKVDDRRIPRSDAARQDASTCRCSATIASPARGCRRRCTSRAFRRVGFKPLATFDEDVDVTTGSVPGVTISGDSLATWKENALNLRSGERSAQHATP